MAIAQGTYVFTGDYLYSPFNNYNNCVTKHLVPTPIPLCPYWVGDCYEGWEWANGTPNCINTASPDGVNMFYAKDIYSNSGEGIYHPYDFTIGDQYKIQVKVNHLNHAGGDSRIEIWAISDINTYKSSGYNGNSLQPYDCGEDALPYSPWYTTPPPLGLTPPQLLGRYKVTQGTVPGLPNGPLTNTLLVFNSPTITTNNTHILIMAYNASIVDDTHPGGQTDLSIDYVEVCKYGGSINYMYNPVPDGVTAKDEIYAGNSSLSPGVTIQPNKKTTFTAAKTFIGPNFYASVTTGNYFLIQPKSRCGEVISNVGESGEEKSGVTSNTSKQILQRVDETFTGNYLFPNPNTGSFTIQLPIAEDCEVRITNIMGATVYQSSMKGEQKKQIQLDGGLPAGNYTLQLRGKTINHIEKLVLTK